MKLAFLLFAALALPAQVTHQRLLNPANEPQNWLTYSGNFAGHRFSPLREINDSNVARLTPAWVYQSNSLQKFETTPLVVDGIMYLTEAPSNVTALDTLTGRVLWRYRRPMPEDVRVCCGQVNRGVAILGDSVFVGTIDSHLVALDAKTGAVRWDVTVADNKTGHSITVAPLAVKDKIIVGIAGGEYGIRGFLDAYDAKTGKLAWRFWTVPTAGDPEVKTWAGDSYKRGSAATWVTGAYDPETNLLYWGTGNPGPDWNGEVRAGDNLYSDCLIALDLDSGKLKWHFQFTPHDVHDWDATEVPVLIDAEFRGQPRKLLLFPNRNAFYYVLDRVTGQFLLGKPYARQTWAKGLDDGGKPVRLPGTFPTVEGTPVWPSVAGANNWYSPSYSPLTKMLYVATRESGSVYYFGSADYKPGEQFNGGGFRAIPGETEWGAIRAFHPTTGDLAWEYKLFTPPYSGVLSTAGNLVFGVTNEGQVIALHAGTGKLLWKFSGGATARTNPMSYQSNGKQYVAVTVGNSLYAFHLQ